MKGLIMDDADTSLSIAENVKKVSFEHMAAAWNAFDDAVRSGDAKRFDEMSAQLSRALDHAVHSLCVLYSGVADIAAEPSILTRLIRERHICFRECAPDVPDAMRLFIEGEAAHVNGKGLTGEFLRHVRDVEIVLKSVESYNFQIRKEVYCTAADLKLRMNKQKIAIAVAAICCLGFISLYPLYRHVKPIQHYVSKGQFFWVSPGGAGETEDMSLRFKVYGDGTFHDYVIDAVEPIDIAQLRFDPCDEQNVKLYIDTLEIATREDDSPVVYTFDGSTGNWRNQNHTAPLEVRDGCLVTHTTGIDPGIRNNGVNRKGVHQIRLRMKVVLYKTFFQWIFS